MSSLKTKISKRKLIRFINDDGLLLFIYKVYCFSNSNCWIKELELSKSYLLSVFDVNLIIKSISSSVTVSS